MDEWDKDIIAYLCTKSTLGTAGSYCIIIII